MAARVAIVGGGTMGSMTAWQLAERGFEVTVYESLWPAHNEGAGAGGTRMFRRLYAEGPMYGQLIESSRRSWRVLEDLSGAEILHRTGGLSIGPANHPVLANGISYATERGLPFELFDAETLHDLYPQHPLQDGEVALFDPEAGVLRSNLAIRAASDVARRLGADVRRLTPVIGIEQSGEGSVRIVTADGSESYDHAVIAGGPWAHRLLPDLPLETRAIFHTWHLVENRQLLRPERHPITLRRSGTDHSFATMSALDGTRVKFAPHFDYPRDIPDIDEMGRHVRLEWQRRSAELIEQLLPGVVPDPVEAQIYPESFTPDGHAVVGALDDDARVIVMGGFSGHGFKLAPGFARAVVDLLESGQSPLLPPEVSPFRDFTRLVSIRDLVLDSEPS